MHISFIYFFPLILSNALAGSGLLQSAPHSYPFRVSLGQSLCPSQKDPHDDFQILHQDTNIYELQCERSHLFNSTYMHVRITKHIQQTDYFSLVRNFGLCSGISKTISGGN